MARPVIHQKPKRVTMVIEADLHAETVKRLPEVGMGSFSEYVARLIRADMKNKSSAALRVGRFAEAAS